jgi:serine-type D-Ala-D-Ala carboxypeptidase (penicillin-binding protein 5/6)
MTGTTAEILTGDIFTIEELFYGLMLPSGNDAAIALANWAAKILIENSNPILTSIANFNKLT